MTGGIIAHNSAPSAGGLMVGLDSTFTMEEGAVISDNTIIGSGNGGGVYVNGGAVFTMNGGAIRDNDVMPTVSPTNLIEYGGGGVFVGQGTSSAPRDESLFIMNGGVIEENAAYIGGGVAAQWNGCIEMNGGIIRGNEANVGGGLSLAAPNASKEISLTMKGGEVSGNRAVKNEDGNFGYGGGIAIAAQVISGDGTLALTIGDKSDPSSVPVISANTSETRAGGVLLMEVNAQLRAEIYHAQIENNQALTYGGGIALQSYETSGYTNDAKLVMEGGTVSGNTAPYGGGVAAYGTAGNSLGMTGVTVTGNGLQTTEQGGGLYIAHGTKASIAGSTISANAADDGGGIYLDLDAKLEIQENTLLSGNQAANEGGAIYTEDCDYGDPAASAAYANLIVDSTVSFHGNESGAGAFQPPENAAEFANLEFARSSIQDGTGWVHLLNNYDINHVSATEMTVYRVVYDANGGTGAFKEIVKAGAGHPVLTLQDAGIDRADYSFTGWNTAADGESTGYTAGDAMVVHADTTLYAQWLQVSGDTEEEESSTLQTDETTAPTTEEMSSVEGEPETAEPADGSGAAANAGEDIPNSGESHMRIVWMMLGGSVLLLGVMQSLRRRSDDTV